MYNKYDLEKNMLRKLNVLNIYNKKKVIFLEKRNNKKRKSNKVCNLLSL